MSSYLENEWDEIERIDLLVDASQTDLPWPCCEAHAEQAKLLLWPLGSASMYAWQVRMAIYRAHFSELTEK